MQQKNKTRKIYLMTILEKNRPTDKEFDEMTDRQ